MASLGEMYSVADIFAAILKAESRLPQGAQQHVSELRVWADNIHDHSLLELEGRLRFAPAAISMVRDLLTEFKRFVDTCEYISQSQSTGHAGQRVAHCGV